MVKGRLQVVGWVEGMQEKTQREWLGNLNLVAAVVQKRGQKKMVGWLEKLEG